MEIFGKGYLMKNEVEVFTRLCISIDGVNYNFLMFANRTKTSNSPDFYVKRRNFATGEYQIVGSGWLIETPKRKFVRLSLNVSGKVYPLLIFRRFKDGMVVPEGEHFYNIVPKRGSK